MKHLYKLKVSTKYNELHRYIKKSNFGSNLMTRKFLPINGNKDTCFIYAMLAKFLYSTISIHRLCKD